MLRRSAQTNFKNCHASQNPITPMLLEDFVCITVLTLYGLNLTKKFNNHACLFHVHWLPGAFSQPNDGSCHDITLNVATTLDLVRIWLHIQTVVDIESQPQLPAPRRAVTSTGSRLAGAGCAKAHVSFPSSQISPNMSFFFYGADVASLQFEQCGAAYHISSKILRRSEYARNPSSCVSNLFSEAKNPENTPT